MADLGRSERLDDGRSKSLTVTDNVAMVRSRCRGTAEAGELAALESAEGHDDVVIRR